MSTSQVTALGTDGFGNAEPPGLSDDCSRDGSRNALLFAYRLGRCSLCCSLRCSHAVVTSSISVSVDSLAPSRLRSATAATSQPTNQPLTATAAIAPGQGLLLTLTPTPSSPLQQCQRQVHHLLPPCLYRDSVCGSKRESVCTSSLSSHAKLPKPPAAAHSRMHDSPQPHHSAHTILEPWALEAVCHASTLFVFLTVPRCLPELRKALRRLEPNYPLASVAGHTTQRNPPIQHPPP
ncbi:hypothetical protein BC827DRAFT_88498 [Russula dissimulans]|nr:hypothetical protein BC827DRAFT_88498 [Russula dissimulans]